MHTFSMMEKRLRFGFVTLCLILMGQAAQIANAQAPKTIEIGPHFGASSYVGELNVWKNLKEWDWKKMNQFDYNLGAVVRYNYDTRWAFRFDYTHGRVGACDTTAAWRPEAMLNFRSTVNDFSFMVEFNFLDYYTGYAESSISPYIFAGVSAFLYTTRPFTETRCLTLLCLMEKPLIGISKTQHIMMQMVLNILLLCLEESN